jgi:lipopolysaccharide transport system ATP-binding protein
MSDIAIKVEGLGKRYRLGQQVGYKTLRETFFLAYHTPTRVLGQRLLRLRQTEDGRLKTEVAGLQSPISGPRSPVPGPQSPVSSQPDHIWALKDVSFEVKQGEAIGIIGRNGSGKSTLLKILSRITAPTEGRAEIHGRVGSLLEVGTGFHPELTGRENVYLNGAIIGMKKAEIDRRFDEIVDFAEIEKFLDTPVKRYSSGMYVRLAFAVAAHLEPEILIVDEVLAVGDAAFQKKCLGKMGDVTRKGRTVLFVSHNMAAIQSLCDAGVVLDYGTIATSGPIGEAIHRYHNLLRSVDSSNLKGIHGVRVMTIHVVPGSNVSDFTPESPLIAEVDIYTERRLPKCYLNFVIEDSEGQLLVHSRTDLYDMWPAFDPGMHRVRVDIPRLSLRGGVYSLWFRLYADTGMLTETADSERTMLEIKGPQVGGAVDIPCHWSWRPIGI